MSNWSPMASAPKDGTSVLLKFKVGFAPGRSDLDHWRHVVAFVGKHPGVCEDGFDIGWSFAAPVGQGGFPDEWLEGWMLLPDSAAPAPQYVEVNREELRKLVLDLMGPMVLHPEANQETIARHTGYREKAADRYADAILQFLSTKLNTKQEGGGNV